MVKIVLSERTLSTILSSYSNDEVSAAKEILDEMINDPEVVWARGLGVSVTRIRAYDPNTFAMKHAIFAELTPQQLTEYTLRF